jgi:putative endonuclease
VSAYRRGHRGELLAGWFLRLKLYRILETRFKTPVGEIDLIAKRFGTIVFVEVKARGQASGETEALTAVNQQRIVRAAQYWAAKNPKSAQSNMRFDVIFVAPKSWPRHLVNAFSL